MSIVVYNNDAPLLKNVIDLSVENTISFNSYIIDDYPGDLWINAQDSCMHYVMKHNGWSSNQKLPSCEHALVYIRNMENNVHLTFDDIHLRHPEQTLENAFQLELPINVFLWINPITNAPEDHPNPAFKVKRKFNLATSNDKKDLEINITIKLCDMSFEFYEGKPSSFVCNIPACKEMLKPLNDMILKLTGIKDFLTDVEHDNDASWYSVSGNVSDDECQIIRNIFLTSNID